MNTITTSRGQPWNKGKTPRQIELNVKITSVIRAHAEHHRAALKIDGLVTESYRLVDLHSH